MIVVGELRPLGLEYEIFIFEVCLCIYFQSILYILIMTLTVNNVCYMCIMLSCYNTGIAFIYLKSNSIYSKLKNIINV